MLQKGTKVYVEGQLKTRKWQNQQGQEVYTTEVVLNQFSGQLIILGGAKSMEGGDYSAAPGGYGQQMPSAPREEINIAQIGDDIPF
jgi:single-strand DNA-binding protein